MSSSNSIYHLSNIAVYVHVLKTFITTSFCIDGHFSNPGIFDLHWFPLLHFQSTLAGVTSLVRTWAKERRRVPTDIMWPIWSADLWPIDPLAGPIHCASRLLCTCRGIHPRLAFPCLRTSYQLMAYFHFASGAWNYLKYVSGCILIYAAVAR